VCGGITTFCTGLETAARTSGGIPPAWGAPLFQAGENERYALMTKQITNSMKILFIVDNSIFNNIAYQCVQNFCPNTEGIFWEHGDIPFPEIDNWKGDIIISFKADVVLSALVLKNASIAAVNFHPAPPNYRGVGTYSWAIHNKESI
jgi:hypothetical protein